MGITQFNQVHHVAIIGSDYQQSKRFYVDVMGFSIIRETYRTERNSYKLDLRVNDTMEIELFSFPNSVPRATMPEACGLRHLAFNVVALEPCITHLQVMGVTVEPIRLDTLTGRRFTFFKDPDGLPLELYEATTTTVGTE
jgi:glyoxylase I family protein